MRCPKLSELPPPPPGKTGWPWTVDSPQLPETRADTTRWPRLSIVTPSLNQGSFIEETIRSVLLQGYPNLEYFVIDGASTDKSVEVIKKYEPWIRYWESISDRGQSHAINKGLRLTTGEVFQFINSDDALVPGCLETIGAAWRKGSCLAAGVLEIGATSRRTVINRGLSARNLLTCRGSIVFHQPGVWLDAVLARELQPLAEDLHYCFDSEFLTRYLSRYPRVRYVDKAVVMFRVHGASKTASFHKGYHHEHHRMLEKFARSARPENHRLRRIAEDELGRKQFPFHVAATLASRESRLARLSALFRVVPRSMLGNRMFVGALRRVLWQG